MPKVVGIDASRAVAAQRTGTENYSLHVIHALSELHTDVRLRLLYPASSNGSQLPAERLSVQHRRVSGRRLWTHLHLARELRRDPVDLLFVPAHVIPLVHPPSVVTIHDLGYLHYPQDHPPRQRRMLDITTRWNLRVARQIIVPSQFTADDIADRYPGIESRIEVVPHGVAPSFRPASAEAIAEVLDRLGIQGPYVLSVGTIQPRKNYPALVEAVAMYNRKNPDHQVQTIIVGRPGWQVNQVLGQLEPFRDSARLTILSDVEDADLPALYSGALAYVQPSRFEGFGMPLLEAMACGAPVVYANASSLPEVAGDAGLAFSPSNPTELADLLAMLQRQPDRRRDLARRGIVRAKWFTWHRSAVSTLSVIENAMRLP